MTMAPTLTSDRLLLTQMTLDHIHALYPLMGSARTGYMDGPFTKRAAWYLLAADVASWTLLGFGGWAITDRNTGQLLGQIALSQPPIIRSANWAGFSLSTPKAKATPMRPRKPSSLGPETPKTTSLWSAI